MSLGFSRQEHWSGLPFPSPVHESEILSRVQLFGTPWTVAYQALPSLGFSRQEYWSGVHKIDSQQEFAVWLRKLKQGLCINLEGWDGEGDGEVQKGGDICIPMADSC